jgi:rubrerythrin
MDESETELPTPEPYNDDLLDEVEIVSYDEADGADRFERFGDLGETCSTCGFVVERTFSDWLCSNCGAVNKL